MIDVQGGTFLQIQALVPDDHPRAIVLNGTDTM